MKNLNFIEKNLLEELNKLKKQEEEIELKLNMVKLARSLSDLPNEGNTISYKLGRILLETRVSNFYLLPRKLLSLRTYSKYRKGLINLSGSELLQLEENMKIVHNEDSNLSVNKEKEQLRKGANEAKMQVMKKNEKSPRLNEIVEERISSILALTNQSYLSLYEKLYPTYILMENNSVQVNNTKSNLLLIDSVWSSINKNWEYALLSTNINSIQSRNLFDKINKLKEKGVKTLFIYREKEEHYEKFKSIMNEADFIFTTNSYLVDNISKDFQQKKVSLIPHSVIAGLTNPSNPVPFSDKKDICYIGEYSKDFNDDDINIVNNFINDKVITPFHREGSHHRSYKNGGWEVISKNKSFLDVLCLIKEFKFNFYVASHNERDIPQKIIDSLACGVPVISTRNSHLENSILKDIVRFVDNIQQVEDIVKEYKDRRWEYSRYSHQCYRFAMNNFPSERLKSRLEKEINNRNVVLNENPLVSIIMASMREQYIDRIVTNISRQSYKNKEFIIITQNFSPENVELLRKKLSEIKELRRFQVVENNTSATLGERQNQAASYAKGSLLAKFDDDDFYFENYLSDMVLPFKFGSYDLVGKAETFIFLEALNKTVLIRNEKAHHREMDFVAGPTFVIKKSTFDKLGGFMELNQSEDSNLLKRLKESGGNIYSSDSFNFVQFRSKDVSNHTWQQKAEAFANSSLHIGEGIPTNIVAI